MLSQKQLERWVEYFNNQPGQAYPCSNQCVFCGVITQDRDKAFQTMRDKGAITKRVSSDYIQWELNNERWVWKHWNQNHRGYRFYKVLVDPNISDDMFTWLVVGSDIYCCSMEVV